MKFSTHSLSALLLFAALSLCVEKKSGASDQANTNNQTDTIHKTEQVVSGGKQKSLDRIHDLKTTMMDYMKLSNPSYTGEDVDACANILTTYVKELEQTHSKEEGMLVVRSTILKLNKLNEKCGSELIETGEREVIAEIIIAASHEKGYNAADEDITEAWREW